MVKNQEFTNQLKRLVGEIPKKVSENLTSIEGTKKEIDSEIRKLGTELQYLMQHMNKSSLFKTTVSLRTNTQDCWNNTTRSSTKVEVKDIVTFNHKGIGILQVSSKEDFKPYGSTYSTALNIRQLLTVLGSKEMHQQILMDLAVNGKKNAMPIWVEAMNIQEDCNALFRLGTENKMDASFKVKESLTIQIPELGNGVVNMKPFEISKVIFKDSHKIVLVNEEDSEGFADTYEISVGSLENYLIFIQFNEELYEMMEAFTIELNNKKTIVEKHIDNIHGHLATHFTLLAMDERDNTNNESYYW